jgi:hypothetical protein
MKFIELNFWDNQESGILKVRPNKIIAYKSFEENTKLYIEGFPNAIAVNKNVKEVEEILYNVDLRTKVSRRTRKGGNTEINQRPDAGSEVPSVQQDYDPELFVNK